jgi:hypothetical protein
MLMAFLLLLASQLLWASLLSLVAGVIVVTGFPSITDARNYRPCFRENQPKRSVSIKGTQD